MQEYLDNKLECPYCGTIRLRIPVDAIDTTEIKCSDCGGTLGTWEVILTDDAGQRLCTARVTCALRRR